jgi:aerobic carbon-monoxide dehydrogenase small subunit
MSNKVIINSTINGNPIDFMAEPQQSLLECLRDTVGLTGSKEGCNDGNCGACSVLINGRLVNSCMVLGVEIEGQEVTTVEGLSDLQELHPVQEAFVEEDGLQCGYCTPGFIVSTKALLDKNSNPTEEEIRFWLAGNLCRCTGYDKIIRSVQAAAKLSAQE